MQSGSDNVLALMKRKYNTRMALSAMALLREAMPDVQFTTDMIVGFPGESDEDFEKTLAFVKEARFLMIHVFPYSKRSGTPAATMSGQIPEETKHARAAELSRLESEIRRDLLDAMNKTTAEVLFETFENGYATGHTPNFIEIRCISKEPLHAETRKVKILENDGNLCTGSILPSP